MSSEAGAQARSTPAWMPRLSLGWMVIALVLIAAALRLWELGERPFHHDESLDAWWSWQFRNGRYTGYDPVYHGPLRFYITAGLFELLGETDAVARLLSAVTGTAAVGLPWFLRHELSRSGTLAASTALTISPTMLYYSRFGREDAQMVFLTLLALVLGLAYLRRPRTSVAVGLAFTLAASFAIKESTYLFGLLLAVYLLVLAAAQFEAQTRAEPESQDEAGDPPISAGFFASGLGLATAGLIAAVVVGSRADQLFPMLALYMAGLFAFALAAAMPRLRQAGIEWSPARTAQVLVALAVMARVAMAYRDDSFEWNLSVVAAIAGIALLVAAVALAVALRDTIPEAGRWAWVAALAGLGLLGVELLERRAAAIVAGDPAAVLVDSWSVSLPALLLGAAAAASGAAVLFADRFGFELPPALADHGRVARPVAAALLAGGIALLLNEFTESEASRVAAIVAIALVAAGLFSLLGALPTTTTAGFRWPPLLRSFAAIGWAGWIAALAMFAVSWWLFFTVFGQQKQDWASGFTKAIDYWDSQQEVNRGGQPWNYYLYALPAYEWFFVILAAVGSWRALRRPTIASGLFVWFAVGSLIIYSYAGERMPWLIAHPLLPMLILAGYGTRWLWKHRSHPAMTAVGVAAAVGLLATTATAWRASFPHGADGREILSQAGQATPQLTAALDRLDNIDAISRRSTGEPATLAIGTENAWPYNWYLRDRPNVLWFTNADGPPADPSIDVIIVDHDVINLEDYPDFTPTLFAMRSWWVPTYHDAGPVGWFKWARSLELWEQQPNPSYAGVSEAEVATDLSLAQRLDQLRHGFASASESLVNFAGADRDVAVTEDLVLGLDDGRDGCGSVDQWFLVRNEWAGVEQQVNPDTIDDMARLFCVNDRVSSG